MNLIYTLSRALSVVGVLVVCALPSRAQSTTTADPNLPPQHQASVLSRDSFEHYIASFNTNDNELYRGDIPNAVAWDFLKTNIPLLDCPDKDIEQTYYFRWWTYRKHIQKTPVGFIISEFLPQVSWAGKYNSIDCAAGHHIYEGRWLADSRFMDDFCLDNVHYHGHVLTILYDKTGERYHRGAGLRVLADGMEIASLDKLGRLTGKLGASAKPR